MLAGGEVGDDFDAQFASARSIELGEEYGLPAAEDEAAVFDPNGFGGAYEGGFDVRVGVAFGVLVIAVMRDEAGPAWLRYRGRLRNRRLR